VRSLLNRIAHDDDAEGWRRIARLACALVPQSLLSADRTLNDSAKLIRPSSGSTT
jgi:hypothetical protein